MEGKDRKLATAPQAPVNPQPPRGFSARFDPGPYFCACVWRMSPASDKMPAQLGQVSAPKPLPAQTPWGRSSAGRASRSQCEGREFDPPRLHHILTPIVLSGLLEAPIRLPKTHTWNFIPASRQHLIAHAPPVMTHRY